MPKTHRSFNAMANLIRRPPNVGNRPIAAKIVFAVILFAVSVGVVWFILVWPSLSFDFRSSLWGPAYLLTHRQSPYRVDVLFPGSDAFWFPTAVGAFFPLGLLPEYQATNLWLVGNVGALIAIIWLSSGLRRPPPIQLAVTLGLAFLFPPVVEHFVQGQFTIIATLALLVATSAAKKLRYPTAGFLIALSLAKPQLSFLAILGILTAQTHWHGVKSALLTLGSTVASILLLTIPYWIAHSGWYRDFFGALGKRYPWSQPSLFVMLQTEWGTWGLVVWILIAVSVFCAGLWVWLKRAPEEAVTWSLALTTLITPYVWSYDFVMLLPLVIRTVFILPSVTARSICTLGFVTSEVLAIWMHLNTDNNDDRYWWIPCSVLATVGLTYLANSGRRRAAGPTSRKKTFSEGRA